MSQTGASQTTRATSSSDAWQALESACGRVEAATPTDQVDGVQPDVLARPSSTEEVSEVAGVTAVDVDLASGRLTVTGHGIDDDAVAAAVAEAGYEVAA